MGVQASQLQDLIATTLKDLPKGEFEACWDLQNYVGNHVLQEEKREIDGGTSIQKNIVFDEDGSAAMRTLYQTDQPTVSQGQSVIVAPWVMCAANYSWDELEILRNKNSAKGFINLLKSRRVRSLWSLANLLERQVWGVPVSVSDTLNAYGVQYWVSFLQNGVTQGGFAGNTVRYSNGTSGTVIGSIDAVANPKWANYADVYNAVDNLLLRKLRQAIKATRFNPAPIMEEPGDNSVGSGIELYTDMATSTGLEDLADKRDDSSTPDDLAGKMLHSFDGIATFNKMPIRYVPQLDGLAVAGTANVQKNPAPIYCLDWTKLQAFVQEGYWMVEKHPIVDRGQHTVYTVFNDSAFNFVALNRRTMGFVLHTPL